MKPLSGVRVLDLGRLIAAPWCTQILGDLGAEVLKVERAGHGDEMRYYGPSFMRDADGRPTLQSGQFVVVNRNKKSLTLDFSNPRGQDIVRSLARISNVFIENYKTGDLKRYGLDYESLKKINPKLVYCSITGFGQSGPYAQRPGTDGIFQAMSGLMSLTGEPDGLPTKAGTHLVDILTGVYAAVGVLAALRNAEVNSAAGAHIDLALLDVAMASVANRSAEFLHEGIVPQRVGNSVAGSVPATLFTCLDGYLDIQAGSDDQFSRLCRGLGLTDIRSDTRFLTRADRMANEDALMAILRPMIAELSAPELEADLLACGVVCSRILSIPESFDDPQVKHRELRIMDEAGQASLANPIRIQGQETHYMAAPTLGQHTREVLMNLLNMGPEVIDQLVQDGVI